MMNVFWQIAVAWILMSVVVAALMALRAKRFDDDDDYNEDE